MSRCIQGGISCQRAAIPTGSPVTIVVDGHPLAAYVRAYVVGGRIYAPVSPLLTRLADRLWIDGRTLVVERGDRRVARAALAATTS